MTVINKIKQLNRTFQKSYHDESVSYFDHDAPVMIEEMINFINAISDKYQLKITSKNFIELLQNQIKDLKSVKSEQTEDVKDAWLIPVKKNVSFALWGFHKMLWNFNEAILNEEILTQ